MVLAIPAVVMTLCMLIKNIAENSTHGSHDKNLATDLAEE